jgi:exopolyphosphatase/guanosine-5'-triphosphate,3'-diphosphate pyrophosphatase
VSPPPASGPEEGGPRLAVVDLGSNSVRLVVFEGLRRNPLVIFNEKAVLRLGEGLETSGELNPAGARAALVVLRRYGAIVRAMQAAPFEILATAAVREARNGRHFCEEVGRLLPGVPLRVLSGDEEAALSAAGLVAGIPQADGLLADIGGGSLELVTLRQGRRMGADSLALGVIRLAEKAGHDRDRARLIVAEALARLPHLADNAGRDLYLVGGTFRALARIHMGLVRYPLTIVHHYTVSASEARDFAVRISEMPLRALEKLPNLPRRRLADLPYAAAVLRRLLRVSGAARVVFSANGLREGWYLSHVPPAISAEEPLLAASRELGADFGRDGRLPPALVGWTDPLFADDTPAERLLREAACWVSDIGSRDHPEYRAENSFLRLLRLPGISVDHYTRAFLALTVALRYEADPRAPFLAPAHALLPPQAVRRAEQLGLALRLAYTFSAGTPELLAATALALEPGRLVLRLDQNRGAFAGEAVLRQLGRLAESRGLASHVVEEGHAEPHGSGRER